MKHVLHIISGDQWAGAESQAYIFLKELNKTPRFILTAVVFNKGKLYLKLNREGIFTVLLDEKQSGSLSLLRDLCHLITEAKPHIIHTHGYKGHILACFANLMCRRKATIVRTLHGLTSSGLGFRHLKSDMVLKADHVALRYLSWPGKMNLA